LYKGIEESELKLHYFPTHSSLVTSLSGYWQSDFYFKDIRATLVKELVPTAAVPAFPDWQRRENTVAVHIRRTDYLVENGFGPLSEKYYRDAILMIRSRVNDPVFIFFSDDIGWCKQQFIAEDFLFCEEAAWDKDYLQLFLMSTCKHQIIANSSFSWWGGWLNANPDKLVIRPEKPFANNALMYESYYPVDWLSIKNQLE
jgi:hypothetical protein